MACVQRETSISQGSSSAEREARQPIVRKPSIQFDYPTPALGKIPAFHSVEEEAEFWDTHDFTDFLDESSPVNVAVTGKLRQRVEERAKRENDSSAKAS